MEIKARQRGEVIIFDLSGRIDVNSAGLIEVVGQCLRDGHSDILCNFEDVDFVDYMGLSVIAIAYKEVVNNSGRIKFVNLPAHIKELFLVTGLDRVVELYATEDIAVNSFKEDRAIENIKKMQLRRRFKRLPLDIKVELKVSPKEGPVCFKGDVLNLSAVGAYIYGCDKFKLGDEVILRLKLPPKMEELELAAKVVWICDRQIQPHLYPGIGLAFSNLSSSLQSKIIEFIERNLSFMSSDDQE